MTRAGASANLNNGQVLEHLAAHTVIVYLAANTELEHTVVERQESNPKPLFYASEFFDDKLKEFLELNNLDIDSEVAPDDFVRWIFPHLVESRRSKYEAIAHKYGYTISAGKASEVRDERDFVDLLCETMDAKA